jgi:hypothetical protein
MVLAFWRSWRGSPPAFHFSLKTSTKISLAGSAATDAAAE